MGACGTVWRLPPTLPHTHNDKVKPGIEPHLLVMRAGECTGRLLIFPGTVQGDWWSRRFWIWTLLGGAIGPCQELSWVHCINSLMTADSLVRYLCERPLTSRNRIQGLDEMRLLPRQEAELTCACMPEPKLWAEEFHTSFRVRIHNQCYIEFVKCTLKPPHQL